ncbi:hypothetical protein NLU13_0082 [Sarocladium strictum]|uniref:Zn(2)-C6 fungal-type domain-containing protein n=1 Tax=Sarocladium strictum TaxID=5046 RepID=A0AA39GNE2_SARSR|nr:hypothetical protein NLU13_0082 [Sarocladium strictum]
MASSPPGGAPRKAAKDLACADCQRRKKRCDKQSPCSNCVKHNVPCIPSSPAPPRKRRQPMKELLERLAACEERLKHCNCHQSQLPLPQLQRPHSHSHSHSYSHSHDHQHGAPPSPPASAASRDAAIANMLDHSSEEDGMALKEGLAAHASTPMTATRFVDYSAAPGMMLAKINGDTRTAGT